MAITLEGVQFTDPVMLDSITGEIFNIEIKCQGEGSLIEEAVLADYPFIVVEPETIKIK